MIRRRLATCALGGVLVAGCSQTAALAPVSGNHLTIVRFAAIDKLLERGIDILTAPICTEAAKTVNCTGATVTGEVITVVSTSKDPGNMTLTIGTRAPLYQGPVLSVIDSAARPTS
jgi:hypothetical protein